MEGEAAVPSHLSWVLSLEHHPVSQIKNYLVTSTPPLPPHGAMSKTELPFYECGLGRSKGLPPLGHTLGKMEPQQQVVGGRMEKADALSLLGRQPSDWELGETEPCVLDCVSPKAGFCFAELRESRSWFKHHRRPLFLLKITIFSSIYVSPIAVYPQNHVQWCNFLN